jgi:hypothetical protein
MKKGGSSSSSPDMDASRSYLIGVAVLGVGTPAALIAEIGLFRKVHQSHSSDFNNPQPPWGAIEHLIVGPSGEFERD